MRLNRIVIFFLVLITQCPIFAYEFEIDGLTYNRILRENEVEPCVEVCGHTTNLEGQHLSIPRHVEYNGTLYKVVGIQGEAAGSFAHSLITSVDIPNTVEYIGDASFYNNATLVDVTIGENVKRIGENAFNSCGIQEIYIPDAVTEMGREVFYGCRNLRQVRLSPNLTKLDIYAFFGCQELEHIELPNSLEGIENCAFQACYKLKEIEIPASVRYIGDAAFDDCRAMHHVTFHEGLDSIGNSAFANCRQLNDVTLPASLRVMEHRNFEYATLVARFKSVTPVDIAPKHKSDSWRTFYKAKVITVPKGSVDAWLAHEYWGLFNVVEEGHEVNVTLDGSLPLADLIVSQYGFTLDETTELTIAGTISDDDFKTLADHRRSLLVLDMSKADNKSAPAGALFCSSYGGSTDLYNHLLYLALPENMTSMGQSAFSLTTYTLVIMSDYDKTFPNYLVGTYKNLYLKKASYLLLLPTTQNAFCFDPAPALPNPGYVNTVKHNIYVPWGMRGTYLRQLWPKDAYDEDDDDPKSDRNVFNMYRIDIDETTLCVKVESLVDEIEIGDVSIDGVLATPQSDGSYALPAGAENPEISIQLKFGIGQSVNLTHKGGRPIITGLRDVKIADGNLMPVVSKHIEGGRIVIVKGGAKYSIDGLRIQ